MTRQFQQACAERPFALVRGPSENSRLAEFESIGMEPEELRKAAEIYRKIKEVEECLDSM